MKLSEIKPNPNNPRVLRDERFAKLKQSIQEFPKMMSLRPMVIDSGGIILGGNMRYRALQDLGFKEIQEDWVKRAEELTEEEKQRFIIADNVGFGDWDWDALGNDWEAEQLTDWGLEIPGWAVQDEGEDFELKDGDREPFQQMTFTVADEQGTVIKNAIADMKETQEYKYAETFGNENTNGNALYLIVAAWAGQRI